MKPHFINTDTLAYPVYRARIIRDNPNVAFPLTFTEFGPYILVAPSTPPAGEVVEETTPVLIGGVYTQAWSVRGFNPAELEEQARVASEAEQDWVASQLQAADIEVRKHNDGHGRVTGTPAAWRTYRNALRDRVIGGVIQGDPSPAGRPVAPA